MKDVVLLCMKLLLRCEEGANPKDDVSLCMDFGLVGTEQSLLTDPVLRFISLGNLINTRSISARARTRCPRLLELSGQFSSSIQRLCAISATNWC